MRIGIVGAGVTGLAAAYRLQARGFETSLFEADREMGGLAGVLPLGEGFIERHYHHFFQSDSHLLHLLEELGLGKQVLWHESQIGYYHGDRIYKFGKPSDLFGFSPLTAEGKIKFALSTLYLQMKPSPHGLDGISIAEWFQRYGGSEAYEVVWKPLLRQKFGASHADVSAAWLWGRVHPRSRSRNRFFGNEQLGYLTGSFDQLFQALELGFTGSRGHLHLGSAVQSLESSPGDKILLRTENTKLIFDKVIVTTPVPIFLDMVSGLAEPYRKALGTIPYRAAVCLMLVLDSPLMKDIYWLNIHNKEIPFAGVIEHTNFVPPSFYGGRHIVYVFNYLAVDDPFFRADQKTVRETYFSGLAKIFPLFNRRKVETAVLSRSPYATPVYGRDYAMRRPNHRTPLPNLFLANTAQVYPQDRNVSNCIANAQALCSLIDSGDAEFSDCQPS